LVHEVQEKTGYKSVRLSHFVFTPVQKVMIFFSCIRGERAFSAVQFTLPVFLGFTFHKTLELRGYKVADLLSMKPLGAL